jgi:hypothetical protein
MIDSYGNVPSIVDREFCFYENNTMKTIYYSGGAVRLRNIKYVINVNGKTDTIYNYGRYGFFVKQYIYENNILEKILVETKEHENREYREYRKQELLFEFNGNELVKIIQSYPNGYRKEIYK